MRGKKTRNHLYTHASRRFAERYGESLTRERWEGLCRIVRTTHNGDGNGATLLFKESNTRFHYLIEDKFIAVYDKARGAISTFLPPENIYSYLGGDDAITEGEVEEDSIEEHWDVS